MDGGPGYRLLTRTLRPARICATIDSGSEWQYRALRLLEGLSLTWGGSHDMVVALEGDGSLRHDFWPLVELFDADNWAQFIATPRHLELIGEGTFENWLTMTGRSLADPIGVDIDEAKRWSPEFMNALLDGPRLSDELLSELRRRTGLATELDTSVSVVSYCADQPAERPAVNVLNLQPLPHRVRIPVVDHLPVEIQLIAAMRWGALSPSAQQHLGDLGWSASTSTSATLIGFSPPHGLVPSDGGRKSIRGCPANLCLRGSTTTASSPKPRSPSHLLVVFSSTGPTPAWFSNRRSLLVQTLRISVTPWHSRASASRRCGCRRACSMTMNTARRLYAHWSAG
jgi:hypothetical protein